MTAARLGILVRFGLHAGMAERFLPLVKDNAAASRNEPGCLRFDVLTDPERPDEVVLYELYDDGPAFDAHLRTRHYADFDSATAGMIAAKHVKRLRLEMAA